MAKVLVVYYSESRHVEQMAMAVAHGARSIEGVEVMVKRLAPLGKPDEPVVGSVASQVPIADPHELADYDGVVFGTPVHFGNMCAEMSWFLRQTEDLWIDGGLIGRVGSVFVSSATQHGGHETAIVGMHAALLNHGMILVGIPYSEAGTVNMADISGGGPYGAGTISANDDQRDPSDVEFDLAEAQGRRVANICVRMYG